MAFGRGNLRGNLHILHSTFYYARKGCAKSRMSCASRSNVVEAGAGVITVVCLMCVPVNTAHAGERRKAGGGGGAPGLRDVKAPLKHAEGRSKPATPRGALCAFLHHGFGA